ncbi:MAG: hypothetical protein DRI61_11785, partial [Chloroflexi bacterium]
MAKIELSLREVERGIEVEWSSAKCREKYEVEFSFREPYRSSYYILYPPSTPPTPCRASRQRAVVEIGTSLFKALFPGNKEELWKEAVEGNGEIWVKMPIPFWIPIELLRHPTYGPLAQSCAFVRMEDGVKTGVGKKVEASALPLRILVAISLPSGEGYFDYNKECEGIQQALSPLVREKMVVLEFLRECTRRLLQEFLDKFHPHVLFFAGHGNGKRGLLFENELGQRDWISAGELGEILQTSPIQLLYLSSCQTAMENGGNMAAQLLEHVPMIIGMSETIGVETSIHIAHSFFHSLAKGFSPSWALQEARHSLYSSPEPALEKDPDWALPRLYSSLSPYPLIAPGKGGDGQGKGRFIYHPDPNGFVGRRRELRELRKKIRQGKRVFAIYGIGGIGKSRLAQQIAEEEKLPILDLKKGEVHAALLLEKFLSLLENHLDPVEKAMLKDGGRDIYQRLERAAHCLSLCTPHAVILHDLEEYEGREGEGDECLLALQRGFAKQEPHQEREKKRGLLFLTSRLRVPTITECEDLYLGSLVEHSLKYDRHAVYHTLTKGDLQFLQREIGGNPRAIEWIARALEAEPSSWESWERIRESTKEVEKERIGESTERTKEVVEEQKLRLVENMCLQILAEKLSSEEQRFLGFLGVYKIPISKEGALCQMREFLGKPTLQQGWRDLAGEAQRRWRGYSLGYQRLQLIKIEEMWLEVQPLVGDYFATEFLTPEERKRAHLAAAEFFSSRGKNKSASVEDLEWAIFHLRKAEEWKLSESLALALAERLIGWGEWKRAEEHLEKSLSIFKRLEDQSGIATSLHQIGMIHEKRGEYEEALECYQKSLAIFERLEDQRGIAKSLGQIWIIHY